MGSKKVMELKGENLIPIIKEAIKYEGEFKLLVSGNSMSPVLKDKRDYVYLTDIKNHTLKKGDIVFIRRDTGQYVLHRIYKIIKDKGFIMNGDAQGWTEIVRNDQVIAYVKKIERKGNEISCDNKIYKFIIYIWMKLRPYRYKMHHIKRKLKFNLF